MSASGAAPDHGLHNETSIFTSLRLQLRQLSALTAVGDHVDERINDAVDALRRALAQEDETVSVTLQMPRSIAEKLLQLIETERSAGAVIVPVKEFYTTTEAASLLGISRASLMKLIDSGAVEAIKVGTHHRVASLELLAYQRARQTSHERANELLTEFSTRSTSFHSNVTFRATGRGEE